MHAAADLPSGDRTAPACATLEAFLLTTPPTHSITLPRKTSQRCRLPWALRSLSTQLRNVSSFLRSPQMQPQPCPPLLPLSFCVFQGFPIGAADRLRESLGRSYHRGSETSQAFYDYPRCNINLVYLFCLSLPLVTFGRLFFLFPYPYGQKSATPLAYCCIAPSPRV